MGAACSSPARVAPHAPAAIAALTVLWDVENLPIPRREGTAFGTAGDLGEALLAHCVQASGAQACPVARLVCVHPERYPIPLKNSLRTRGVQMLDAGPKRGAVDTHLKCFLNDAIVDALLEEGGGGGGRAGGGRGTRWLWLASGDSDFAGDVRRARRCGFRVGIIHGAASNADYFEHADATVQWSAVLAECEKRAAGKRGSGGGGSASEAAAEASAEPTPRRGAAGARSSGGSSSDSAVEEGRAGAQPPPAAAAAAATAELCRNFSSSKGCTKRNCRFRHLAAAAAVPPLPGSPDDALPEAPLEPPGTSSP
jgi:hypothetical protein